MTNKQKNILSWLITVGSAVLIALLLITFVFRFHYISGSSMEQTLHDHEFVFVFKLPYVVGSPSRGDVVNTHFPEGGRESRSNYAKRVIGLPGETIEIKNGQVYLNDQPGLDEWMGDHRLPDLPKQTIAEGHYFVMGDNRSSSMDSRTVGQIPQRYITGRIEFVLFPFGDMRKID